MPVSLSLPSKVRLIGAIWGSGSLPGVILSPKGHLAVSADIFGCHSLGKEVLLHLTAETRAAADVPQWTAQPQQGTRAKCHECGGKDPASGRL